MSGADATIRSVDTGDAEFSFSDVTLAAAALNGEEAFKGRPVKNVRAVAKLETFTVGIVVPKDSSIRTVQDVKGKRMSTGWNSFPQGRILNKAMLATGGLTVDDVVGVPTPELIRAADDLKSGKVDATIYAPQAPKMKEVDAAIGVRFLSLPNTPQAVAAVKNVRQDFYLTHLTPRRGLTGVLEPIDTLAFDLAVTTGAQVKDEVVYKVVKAIHDNGAELKKASPTFGSFRTDDMAKQFSTLRYHPAAIKYYREQNMWPGS